MSTKAEGEPSSHSQSQPIAVKGLTLRGTKEIDEIVSEATKGASKFVYYTALLAAIRHECTEVVFNEAAKAWVDSDIAYKSNKGAVKRRGWRNAVKLRIHNIVRAIEAIPDTEMTIDEKTDILAQCEKLRNDPKISPTEHKRSFDGVLRELTDRLTRLENKEVKFIDQAVSRLRAYYSEHREFLLEQLNISDGNEIIKDKARCITQKCDEVCFLKPQRDIAEDWIRKVEGGLAKKRSYDDYAGPKGKDETYRNVRRDNMNASTSVRIALSTVKMEQLRELLRSPFLEDELKLEILTNLRACKEKELVSDDIWAKLETEKIERLIELKAQYGPLNSELLRKIAEINGKDVGEPEKILDMRKLEQGHNSIVKQLAVLDAEISACGEAGLAFLEKLKTKGSRNQPPQLDHW